jgi:alkyldihydroxyacetonephosphate synthase
MTAPNPRMRWWGWGVDRDATSLSPAVEALLRKQLGWTPRSAPAVALDDVVLPEPQLRRSARDDLAGVVGAVNVRTDRLARVAHAVGKSTADLIRIRAGDGSPAPDAVVYPASAAEVEAVLRVCADAKIAVTPFGGGTSVVGGVEPMRAGFAGAVSLDLARMDQLVGVDRASLLATFSPGMTGPQVEAALAPHGLTLGHFPQSFEYATLGGFVATRSAGQNSTGYGRIDALVQGLRLIAPAGELVVPSFPSTAAGPSVEQLIVGSEGTLGVITEATLRVRPRPETHRFETWSFASFEAGADALRELEQAETAPTVARLSDVDETRMGLALGVSNRARRLVGAYLAARGQRLPCLAILGYEGSPLEVRARSLRAMRTMRAHGGVYLGTKGGEGWRHTRFAGPYLRDALLDRGVFVETLETATVWSNVPRLYAEVRSAIAGALGARGTPAFVLCHISHLYPSGCSLYFTYFARQEEGAELAQWQAAKTAASDAIVAGGGTITHHHAVGRDHAPWLSREIGPLGIEALRALKERLDPQGVMNPGKLMSPTATALEVAPA